MTEHSPLYDLTVPDNRIGEGVGHGPSPSPLYDLTGALISPPLPDPPRLPAILCELEGHLAAAAVSAAYAALLATGKQAKDQLRAQALVLERFRHAVRALLVTMDEE